MPVIPRPNAGDDPTPHSGDGGPRHAPAQLAGDPAFTATYASKSSTWKANTAYKAGELVTQGGVVYAANADFTSGGSFVAGNWTAVGGGGSVSDATTGTKGIVQLAGDLAGTAASPTVAKVNGVAVSGTAVAGQSIVATSASAASWTSQPMPPLSYGDVSSFRKARAALAKVRAGTGNMKIMCVGDSTTGGLGTDSSVDTSKYPGRLSTLLNSYFAPASLAYATAQGSGLATPGTGDSRIAFSGSFQYNSFGPGPGSWYIPSGSSGTLTFTPGFAADTLEVGYMRLSGYGSATVNADGGSSLGTVNCNNASQSITTATFTTTLGTHVWNVVGASVTGNVIVAWLRAYDSTSRKIHVANMGHTGTTTAATSTNWTSSGGWGQLDGITAMAPDLTIISLGINDAGASTAAATWQANMGTIITTAQASGDVLLCSVIPSNTSQATYEAQYQALFPTLAATYGCAWLDAPWTRWGGSYTTANSLGFMADNLHGSAAGYADWAQALASAIRNV